MSGGSRVALVPISLRARITIRTRVARIPVGRRWIAWISIGCIRVSGISVNRIAVSRVTVIGARWRCRCSRDSAKYPGCPSNRCSEGSSRPTARRGSNSSARGRAHYPSAEAALDGIIGVCTSHKAQPQCPNHKRRGSDHRSFSRAVIHSKRPTRYCDHPPVTAGMAAVRWHRLGSPRCRTRPDLS